MIYDKIKQYMQKLVIAGAMLTGVNCASGQEIDWEKKQKDLVKLYSYSKDPDIRFFDTIEGKIRSMNPRFEEETHKIEQIPVGVAKLDREVSDFSGIYVGGPCSNPIASVFPFTYLKHMPQDTKKASRAISTGAIKSVAGKEAEVTGTTLSDISIGYLDTPLENIDYRGQPHEEPSIPWQPFAAGGLLGLAALAALYVSKRKKQPELVQAAPSVLPSSPGARQYPAEDIQILEVRVSGAKPYQK